MNLFVGISIGIVWICGIFHISQSLKVTLSNLYETLHISQFSIYNVLQHKIVYDTMQYLRWKTGKQLVYQKLKN